MKRYYRPIIGSSDNDSVHLSSRAGYPPMASSLLPFYRFVVSGQLTLMKAHQTDMEPSSDISDATRCTSFRTSFIGPRGGVHVSGITDVNLLRYANVLLSCANGAQRPCLLEPL